MGRKKNQKLRDQALKIFKKHGGLLRTHEALKEGIYPRLLYELRDMGLIDQIQVGLYGLKDLPGIELPDFAVISKLIPDWVICLISALNFHNLTVQIPHFIYIAIRHDKKVPKIDYPPIKIFKFSDKTFYEGIETYNISGIKEIINF